MIWVLSLLTQMNSWTKNLYSKCKGNIFISLLRIPYRLPLKCEWQVSFLSCLWLYPCGLHTFSLCILDLMFVWWEKGSTMPGVMGFLQPTKSPSSSNFGVRLQVRAPVIDLTNLMLEIARTNPTATHQAHSISYLLFSWGLFCWKEATKWRYFPG